MKMEELVNGRDMLIRTVDNTGKSRFEHNLSVGASHTSEAHPYNTRHSQRCTEKKLSGLVQRCYTIVMIQSS